MVKTATLKLKRNIMYGWAFCLNELLGVNLINNAIVLKQQIAGSHLDLS